jgi:cytochrome c biogenesis protein ResB
MNNNKTDKTDKNIDNEIYKTTKYIGKLYDKLTYYDNYGGSIVIFLLITTFVFLVHSYCIIIQFKEEIADDWTNQRCKPQNISFAGYITKPEGKTATEYTNENFQYCVQVD